MRVLVIISICISLIFGIGSFLNAKKFFEKTLDARTAVEKEVKEVIREVIR